MEKVDLSGLMEIFIKDLSEIIKCKVMDNTLGIIIKNYNQVKKIIKNQVEKKFIKDNGMII
jgi:hypothetical protein